MSLKAKLISSISAICLVLALLSVGVWAVSTASVTLGGTVSFTADNIYAKVTGSITGTQESISLDELNYTAESKPSDDNIASWANNSMTFTSGNLITMTITVQNLSEERSLFVKLTDNTTTTNITKTLKQGSNNYTSATEVEVAARGTTTFTMTLSVSVLEKSASATVAYQVDLRDANAEAPESAALLHDTTNDYYYVEMGTYNSQPVRWRVVGVKNEDTGVVERYTYNESQAPTGELTFIQETVTTSHVFGSVGESGSGNLINEGNCDYSTSALRQYLTGHDCALTWEGNDMIVTGNYLNDLGITENNAVYKKIKARSITDLYKDITWDGATTILDSTPIVSDKTTSDKLWIPSVAEIYSLVGGGVASAITESEEWDSTIKENIKYYNSTNTALSYWLRSPSDYYEWSAHSVAVNGYCNGTGDYVNNKHAVRPAFILEI